MLTLFSEGTLMHVRHALALTLVVPLLLAGCTDEPEPTPKIPDPTSSSPTPTATESETAEVESAEDFIRRWVEVGDEMQVTGETDAYTAMTDKSCEACRDFAAAVRDVYKTGGSIEFAGTKVDRIVNREKKPPTYALTKTLPKTVIQRGGSTQAETLPAGQTTLLVILGGRPGGWLVTYYGVL